MISICLASRGRPETFKDMWMSALNHADNPDDVEFIVYRDIDDDTIYEYPKNMVEIRSITLPLSEMVNACYPEGQGPIYMFTADDFMFESDHWDTEVKRVFDEYEDKIVFVSPDNSDWNRWKFGVIGFLHKNWIEAVGHFIPTCLGESTDRWINDVGIAIGRVVHLLNMKTHHLNLQDLIHKNKKIICRRRQWNQMYHMPKYVSLRLEDVKKLKEFINEQNDCLLHR